MVNTDNAFERLLRDERAGPSEKWQRHCNRPISKKRQRRKASRRAARRSRGFWEIVRAVIDGRCTRKHRRLEHFSAAVNAARQKFRTTETYPAYLKSGHWRARRKRYVARHGIRCRQCGSVDRCQLHHKSYARMFNEPDGDLVMLCDPCHRDKHNLPDLMDSPVDQEFAAIVR